MSRPWIGVGRSVVGGAFAALCLMCFFLSAASAAAKSTEAFSLDGPTLLKAGERSTGLIVADLNGDGLPDILTVANDRGVLELRLQDPSASPPFVEQEIVLDLFVQGVAVLDADGDGRMDVLLAGSPPRLTWLRQGETGVLATPERLDREASDLVAADLTRDGVADLVLVHRRRIEVVPNGRRGLDWANAQVYWSAYDIQGAPLVADLDNDGLPDLIFRDAQRNDRLIVRFQTPEGRFPEEALVSTAGLSALETLPQTPGRHTLLGVVNKTGTLEQLTWEVKQEVRDSSLPTRRAFGRIRTVAFDPDWAGERLVADWVPLGGGGAPCLLVASPSAPSLRLASVTRTGSLRVDTVPGLTGVTHILPVPPEKKRRPWTAGLLSRTEKSLAFARFGETAGTFEFPQPAPFPGVPLTAVVADLGGRARPDLALCRADETGSLVLDVWYDFDPETFDPAPHLTFAIPGDEGDRPSDLVAIDLNHNGETDLILLFEYADPLILMRAEEGWAPLRSTGGMLESLLAGARTGSVRSAPLAPGGHPSLLVVKENYARAVHLDKENRLVVDHQFNGRNQRSRLRAAATASPGKSTPPHVVLLDAGNQCLTVYRPADRDGGTYEVDRHVELDEADYQRMLTADINDSDRDDILLLAPDRLTVLYSGMPEGALETVGRARTEVEDGQYGLVAARALLPKDTKRQILVLESTENVLEFFLDERDEGELRRFYRFKIFQGDQVRQRRGAFRGRIEPREIVVADLDGDGKPDLLLLMHDVIGIYYKK